MAMLMPPPVLLPTLVLLPPAHTMFVPPLVAVLMLLPVSVLPAPTNA